jgi:hypothetical protein
MYLGWVYNALNINTLAFIHGFEFFLCCLIYFVFSNNHMYTCNGSVIVYCYWMNHNVFVSLGIFWKVANLIWSYYLLFANFYFFEMLQRWPLLQLIFNLFPMAAAGIFWMFVCGVGVIRQVVTWFRTTLVVVVIFYFRFRGGLLRLSHCHCLTGFM